MKHLPIYSVREFCEIIKSKLVRANLRGANLGGANLWGANLGDANLRGADLGGANLGGANLGDANLGDANLGDANLRGADLGGANLRGANLRGADLGGADLGDANLGDANLGDANLGDANLGDANLRGADLGGANLGGANLRGADLWGANLSATKEYQSVPKLFQQLEQTSEGFLCYKSFGENYTIPANWKIEAGSIIEEPGVNRTDVECGSGINVATLGWCKQNCHKPIWQCLIKFEDLETVFIPRTSDGKFRCGKVTLIKRMDYTKEAHP